MSVLDRSALEASPLADLHAIASELGLDSFRRLRKPDLIDAILARQGGPEPEGGEALPEAAPAEGEEAPAAEPEEEAAAGTARREAAGGPERPSRRRRGRGRRRPAGVEGEEAEGELEAEAAPEPEPEDEVVEGTVELLDNGSGFVRLAPPEPSEGDVYVSAAQVRRCELVAGDVIAGPVRRPRRSERHPSLVRVDTINGRPAEEVVAGTRYEDLPCGFATEPFELGGEDPTLQAIARLTPLGRGSRVVIAGPPRAGKTETLRRLAGALAGQSGLQVSLVLAGVRPEELAEWQGGPLAPSAAIGLAAPADAQGRAVEHAVEQGRRVAARGGDAVVLVDTLDGLAPAVARRVLAAARNLVDGGSLTVIATATRPLGGETTVVALDPALTAARGFPALDLAASGTTRAELLVGEAGLEEIARARAEAVS